MQTTTPAYYIHDISPFAVQFSENFGIRWYGLAYIAGLIGAGLLLALYAKRGRSLLPSAKISDLIVALAIGVMVGGRLGEFLLYNRKGLQDNPLSFFRIWEGGMASHGGFVGVALAAWWFSRKEKIPYAHLGDLIASVTAMGLFFGRIANFINGELWGKPTSVAWAVIFPQSANADSPLMPRHPSQLYEAALEGLLLLVYMQWRFWRSDTARTRPGQLCGEFLIGYALARTIGEIFREPDGQIDGLSSGTYYSIFIALGGLAFIIAARKKASSATL